MSDEIPALISPAAVSCTAAQLLPSSDMNITLNHSHKQSDAVEDKIQESLLSSPVLIPTVLPSPIPIPLPPIPMKTTQPFEPPKTVESESQTDAIIDLSADTIIGNSNHNCANQVSNVPKSATSSETHQSEDRRRKQQQQQYELVEREVIAPKTVDRQPIDTITNGMEINPKYLGEPENSSIRIHDKLIDRTHFKPNTADSSESEEDDQLKPLMIDNHQECYMSKRQIQQILQQNAAKDLLSSSDTDRSFNHAHQFHHRQPLQPQPQSQPQSCLIDAAYDSSDLVSSDEASKGPTDSNPLPDGINEIDTLSSEEIPDDRMAEEIVEQVEFYFSNENILKDAFLLKHVRRNKEGFVSLKLVSSFKRVRQLTKDWRAVGHAIRRKSRKIELNDVGSKIRRIEPLPTFDETMPSRTIVACDLPVDKLSIERVSDIFAKCGEIALIRILRPGAGIPVDVRQFMNKFPEMQMKECALVEFTESHAARNALNMDGPFKVYEMVAPKKKTGKKSITVTKLIENYKYNDNNYERNRGGVMTTMENDLKFKLRRNNSDYYMKPEHAHICTQRRYSFNPTSNNNDAGNNVNMVASPNRMHGHMQHGSSGNIGPDFMHYPRRISNFSVASSDAMSRKYSSCSEGYSSCSEFSRRPSGASTSDSRRTSNSNCSDYNCSCSRRGSQVGGGSGSLASSPNISFANDLLYRRMSAASHGSDYNNVRHHSNGSITSYERTFSNPQEMSRRISIDSNEGHRKLSTGSIGSDRGTHEPYRKYSNGFDPHRKLSNGGTEQFFNGRRLSSDSGYDRKMSFGSDYGSSPRSRSGSFLTCQHKNSETVVRTPIGPDGSKGFASRARKLGQIVSPV